MFLWLLSRKGPQQTQQIIIPINHRKRRQRNTFLRGHFSPRKSPLMEDQRENSERRPMLKEALKGGRNVTKIVTGVSLSFNLGPWEWRIYSGLRRFKLTLIFALGVEEVRCISVRVSSNDFGEFWRGWRFWRGILLGNVSVLEKLV